MTQPYNALQVSRKLNTSPSTVTNWIEKKRLNAVKVGGRYLIFNKDLIDLIGKEPFIELFCDTENETI